jgi:adenosylhomocysteinase
VSPTKRAPNEIADASLAEAGEARIAWADSHMPVLARIRERFAADRPLEEVRIAASLHVTPETAVLVRTLIAGGARVALCASNPLSTQDDVAAALVARDGAEVHARRGEDMATYYRHLATVADVAPHVTLDDGADIAALLHAERPELLDGILGGTEDTATGVLRLRALQAEGRLGYPVIAVNEAQVTRLFDARYGTGQSALDGVVRATNVLLAGRVVVIVGYGRVGRGIAARARGAGAIVVVCEVDPVRAVEARMDGHEVMPAGDAAARADVILTATGGRDAVAAEEIARLRDGAILANAGHFDVEIDLAALRAAATGPPRRVRPAVDQYELPDGRRVNLLAEGRVVNLGAAEGHPPAVMDVAAASQALSVEHLVQDPGDLVPGVHDVPAAIDAALASLTLASLGIAIDGLTPDQEAYLHSWEQGT